MPCWRTKLDWDQAKYANYVNYMAELDTVEIDLHDVNHLKKVLIDAIKVAAENLGLTKTFQTNSVLHRKDKPWFDKECRTAYIKQKKAQCKCSKSQQSRTRAEFIDLRKQFRLVLRKENRSPTVPSTLLVRCEEGPA
ncbi:hypothetical protein QAD02_013965 [Eretmocerus hayati]|uniref:Uncharacterized protein n=1 Tax=Eretmocerus hayati TaxID=131215 RepID=A0ACC2P515_9HYME|nr:hypothetical protein QAD02_013965 [Eretmocerus hayati]